MGLVVERTRPDGKEGTLDHFFPYSELNKILDAMQWYCPNLSAHGNKPHLVTEKKFQCTDLGTQLKPIIDEWNKNVAGRKCGQCGYQQGERELIGALNPPEAP